MGKWSYKRKGSNPRWGGTHDPAQVDDKPARVPHADRPAVVREFCRCLWVYTRDPRDPDKPRTEHRYVTHPDCPLHGDNAQPSPF